MERTPNPLDEHGRPTLHPTHDSRLATLIAELKLNVFNRLDYKSRYNLLLTCKGFSDLREEHWKIIMEELLCGYEPILATAMYYIRNLADRHKDSRNALWRAAGRSEIMHISIEYDTKGEGLDWLKELELFLKLCFPPGFKRNHPCPLVVATIYPSPDQSVTVGEEKDVLRRAGHLAGLSSAAGAKATFSLRFNTYFPLKVKASEISEVKSFLKHTEGLFHNELLSGAFDDSIEPSARFLTLCWSGDWCTIAALKKTALCFKHVRDLRLTLEGEYDSSALKALHHFNALTYLHLVLDGLGHLDFTQLTNLHTLGVSSRNHTADFKLSLPEGIQSIAIEGCKDHRVPLSAEFMSHLHGWLHSKSIELRYCSLPSVEEPLLSSFPASLTSLRLQHIDIGHSSLGAPHSNLQELRIGSLQDEAQSLGSSHLKVLSCTWNMLSASHVTHLKVLHIIHRPGVIDAKFETLTDFKSLTELWVHSDLFSSSAQTCATDHRILEVLPSALETLVLRANDDKHSTSWNFKALTHLRCLGLSSSNMKIEWEKLPFLLRTIAVDSLRHFAVHNLLSDAEMILTRVVPIGEDDWDRGPQPKQFLAQYSHLTSYDIIDNLQSRQRTRDVHGHGSRLERSMAAVGHSSHH